MKIEQARQIANKAIDELTQALERGHSEELTNYLAAMARFRQYSWHNLVLIVSQRPDATRVAGFKTWEQLGRNVKKGAKGIMILGPVVTRKSKEEALSENEEEKAAVGSRAVFVFDQNDTEGKPIADLGSAQGDPPRLHRKAKAIHRAARHLTGILGHHLSSAGAVLAWKDRAPARPDCGRGVRYFGPRSGP
jgi:hypothetical protein